MEISLSSLSKQSLGREFICIIILYHSNLLFLVYSLFCTKTDATLFVLAIPTENGPNDLYGYSKQGSVTPWKVYNWIEQTLKFSVQSIGNRSELVNQWIKFPLKYSTDIKTTERTLNRCVLFSNVDPAQLLVYVLGLQMRNRLKFGVMVVGEGTSTSIQDAGLNLTRASSLCDIHAE